MDIAFRMSLQIGEQTVCRKDGGIDMIIERFIVNQLSERAVLGAYIHEESVDVVNRFIYTGNRSFEVRCLDISNDGIEIRNRRIGIIDDARNLVVHQSFEVRRHVGQISGYTVHIGEWCGITMRWGAGED